LRHNCNTIKKFLTSLFLGPTVQVPSTKEYSKVKIILDEADIKAILTDHVRAAFGDQFNLEDLKTYSYTPTATFTEEADNDTAQ